MGLFNRKGSKVNTNGAFDPANSTRTSSSSIKSPPPTKVVNGTSFSSPSVADVSLPPPPDPTLDPAAYLRSIYSVRARTKLVYQRAKRNQLNHFDVDGSKFRDTADYVVSIIKVESLRDVLELDANNIHRETTLQIIKVYPPTDDGSISKLVVDLV